MTDQHQSLAELYIADLRRVISVNVDAVVETQCVHAATQLRLVHALDDFGMFDTSTSSTAPALLSRPLRGKEPSPAQKFAGTANDVFFYVGAPMKKERPGIIAFRSTIETDSARATPWDSGGLHARRGAKQWPDEADRKILVQRRTMPAPTYRRALATTLMLRFGGDAQNYLRSNITNPTDPDSIYDGTLESFTYEVRLPNKVDIQVPELAFAAVNEDYMNRGLHDFKTWCGDHGVPFVVVGKRSSYKSVRDAAIDASLAELEQVRV